MSLEPQIEGLYSAFSSQPRPASIAVCPCCVSDKAICSLLSTQLRKLSPDQLTDYASSVLTTVGSPSDFRYFLPRILELSIREPDRWWPSIEVVAGKLVLADWMSWPASERNAISAAFDGAFELSVRKGSTHIYEVDAVICGLAILGVDLKPYLNQLSSPHQAEVLFAYYERNSTSLQKGKLSNSFWSDHKALAKPIVDWLNSEPIQRTITDLQREKYG